MKCEPGVERPRSSRGRVAPGLPVACAHHLPVVWGSRAPKGSRAKAGTPGRPGEAPLGSVCWGGWWWEEGETQPLRPKVPALARPARRPQVAAGGCLGRRPGLAPAPSRAPRVSQRRQRGSSLIKVQGFNRSFKKPKLLPPPASHLARCPRAWQPGASTAEAGRAKVPAYSRGTAASPHSQLHLICPETGWR